MKTITDRHFMILKRFYAKRLFFKLNCIYVNMDTKASTDYSCGFGITTEGSPRNQKEIEKYSKELIILWNKAQGLDITTEEIMDRAENEGWNYSNKDYNNMIDIFIKLLI